jgi:DNA sulfur modification protein DndB
MQGFELRFPAVRGIQAGREFYVAMCPLAVVPRLFAPDESSAPPIDRGQRVLNKGRLPRLARFLADNPEDYAVSAITASIDGDVEFQGSGDQADWELGRLVIPMSSNLLITDGQHRWRAICEAVKQEPKLEEESVPVVFYVDEGLERRQQMFADLNMHAVRPTRSLGILYDHRDPVAALAREMSEIVPVFKGRTEVEKTTISNRSGKLFTLSAIYQATAALLSKREGDDVEFPESELAARYWTVLGEVLPGWREVIAGSMKPWELRARYIHAHGVVLQALGAAGAALLEEVSDWESHLRGSPLKDLDWSRSNTRVWEGRALSDGRVSKAQKHVALTGALFKAELSLSLSKREKDLERELEQSRRELWGAAS